MIIYRIQNNKGYGPYTGPNNNLWKDEGHDIRVPLSEHNDLFNKYIDIRLWCEESDDNFPDLLKYGFSSIDQLESWFTQNELKKLDKLGYKIIEISVSKIFYLNGQIAFIP